MSTGKVNTSDAAVVDSYEPTGKIEKEFGEANDALDSSAQVLATSSYDYTDAEANALRWKIDWLLMPVLLITGMLSAIDKIIISNAALYGLTADLHLTSQQYSWVGSYRELREPGCRVACCVFCAALSAQQGHGNHGSLLGHLCVPDRGSKQLLHAYGPSIPPRLR